MFLKSAVAFFFLIFASSYLANPTRPCVDLKIPVHVTANATVFNVTVNSDIDAVDLLWELQTWSQKNISLVKNVSIVQQAFTISARFCVPSGSQKAGILQIATHGFGFDKRYWDSERDPDQYSYVNAALKAGYSILVYDRLGTGSSDKPDAYGVLQSPVELEILNQLVVLARAGQLVPSAQVINGVAIPKFQKIVVVGHSYGSAVTSGFLAKYGPSVDGAVITGLVPDNHFGDTTLDAYGWEYAVANDKIRFGSLPSGYLVQGTVSNTQRVFFKKGAFDPAMLVYAEQIKQPVSVGELLSFGFVFPLPAPAYTGPLLYALAEYDVAVCGGDCVAAFELQVLKALWPNASDVSAHIQPKSGHGLTLHINATGQFQDIFSYLNGHGL